MNKRRAKVKRILASRAANTQSPHPEAPAQRASKDAESARFVRPHMGI
jgi:hypothetical protein